MLHFVLFFIFAAICLGGAINLLAQKHPISSALSLIVVMGSLAVEYLLLGAEFVAIVQVIIYAGAIMVLFVFVIMLLNAGIEEHTRGSRVTPSGEKRERAQGGYIGTQRRRGEIPGPLPTAVHAGVRQSVPARAA